MSVEAALEKVRAVDPAVLVEVVRQDQRDPSFEITSWAVRRLSDRGLASGDGPFCFYGHGRSGQSLRPWSVVLKISITGEDALRDPTSMRYYQREWLAYRSRLLESFAAPLAFPRCYGIWEQADGTWIWMEQVFEKNSGRWGIPEFAFAARELGRFGGLYASGRPNPDQPWLSRDQTRSWITTWSPENAWNSDCVQRMFPPQSRARVFRLWDERECFMAALDGLPQHFSHFDCMRRNLMIRARPDGHDELVAIDWAMCGIRPIGSDLSHLLGMSSAFYDWDPADIATLEQATEPAYLAGLREAGWQGDPRIVRLGYTAWIALWLGLSLAPGVAVYTTDAQRPFVWQQFNRTPEEFAVGWAKLCEYALDRADEARQIMASLKSR